MPVSVKTDVLRSAEMGIRMRIKDKGAWTDDTRQRYSINSDEPHRRMRS